MPLYESRPFAENRIDVKPEWRGALALGPDKVVQAVIRLIADRQDRQRPLRLAFDGWYNIDWAAVTGVLQQQAQAAGLKLFFLTMCFSLV